MKLRILTLILLIPAVLGADPVIHKFQLWGGAGPEGKLNLYWGCTNGFLQWRGSGAPELSACLQKMTPDQAMAMVDKYYRDHPERWSQPLGGEILRALTMNGGPCEGKNVWEKN
jgi:hypothetical protein